MVESAMDKAAPLEIIHPHFADEVIVRCDLRRPLNRVRADAHGGYGGTPG